MEPFNVCCFYWDLTKDKSRDVYIGCVGCFILFIFHFGHDINLVSTLYSSLLEKGQLVVSTKFQLLSNISQVMRDSGFSHSLFSL